MGGAFFYLIVVYLRFHLARLAQFPHIFSIISGGIAGKGLHCLVGSCIIRCIKVYRD